MTQARAVTALGAGLAAVAVAVLVLAAVTAASGVSFDLPPAATLFAACRRFALPELGLASVMSLALGSLAVAVLVLGLRSAIRQVRATRRLLRGLAVHEGGPAGAVLFEARPPMAFCAGLLRPRRYVSTGAVAALTTEELDAVMAHEAHHARLRDPLRLLVARVVGDALFFLSAVRRLADRYSALAELAADSAATRGRGPQALASALLTFEATDPAVVGIAPERVDSLLGERPARALPVALIAAASVLLIAVAVVALRLQAAHGAPVPNVPLLAAGLCMWLMAVAPLFLGAGTILGARRAFAASRAQ